MESLIMSSKTEKQDFTEDGPLIEERKTSSYLNNILQNNKKNKESCEIKIYDENTILKYKNINIDPPEELVQFAMQKIKKGGLAKRPSSVHVLKKNNTQGVVISDIDMKDLMRREMNEILNKISANNFEKLAEQIKMINITSKIQLQAMAQSTFDKAIVDMCFTVVYAKLCRKLATIQFIEEVKEEKENESNKEIENKEKKEDKKQKNTTIKFLTILLEICQKAFETELERDTKTAERYDIKAKRMGIMKFIGELCNAGLLHHGIIDKCLLKMCKKKTDPTLECFHKLLFTVSENYKKRTDNDYHKIKAEVIAITKSKEITSKIKYTFMDLLEKHL